MLAALDMHQDDAALPKRVSHHAINQHLRRPIQLASVLLCFYAAPSLADSRECERLRQAAPANPSVSQLRALGRCAMPQRPGEAVIYYQAAEARGDTGSRLPLADALEASGDSIAALAIWKTLADNEWTANARLTAARSALNADNAYLAYTYWKQAAPVTADDWALGAAIAQREFQVDQAMDYHREALKLQPRADRYYAAAVTAAQNRHLQQSTAWLAEAVRLAPEQPRYGADYGMRLARSEEEATRARSIPYLERATQAFPEDYRLGETLAWRYDEVANSAAARKELRRALDVEQALVDGDDVFGSLQARTYQQRQVHERLSRRDSITLSSTWAPAGMPSNNTLRDNRADGRGASQNVQLAMWDHALGDEPSRNARTFSVYARALFGASGRNDYAQTMGTGVGLRYKPFSSSDLNLYTELYHQRRIDDAHYGGLSLGQLISPSKGGDNYADLRGHAESSNDLLLRATNSLLDQGKWRSDWRAEEDEWDERFLYLDAAWWTRAGDHQWLSRYQRGHTWKLSGSVPQTLMPYGFLEFSNQQPDNQWRQDLRTGLGLRWQWWFDDDRYNAYRGSLKVRAEYQQSLGGNLYEHANGVLLGAELTI
ncbi:Bacteriophage adsorption protein A [Pseudomonas fluorescens]|uniref:Bacteriophage adsorption protein A n=1 Tax=Pseudomonas fluorescens TaxID=294 RepID=A0A5E6SMV6_PSEFL|nr:MULTISPECIES: hypothetical protein [Pseudomonas]VVM82279.1 Bacteriophage adsorption protein A [Pseudomonas fluorescens]